MKVFRFTFIVWLVLLIGTSITSYGQDSLSYEQTVRIKQRVKYIYTFTKYIDWEDLDTRNEFIIGVFGIKEDHLIRELERSAKEKLVKDKTVKIENFKTISGIQDADILYLNENTKASLDSILPILFKNNTLLISEGYPFHQSMINFIEIDREFHFEMDEQRINQAGLLVDPNLATFSIQSTADWQLLYDKLQDEINTVQEQKKELEKLSSEISALQLEVADEQKKLEETLDQLKGNENLLLEKEDSIRQKNLEIEHQIRKLRQLNSSIEQQLLLSEEQAEVLKKQQASIENQEAQIALQNVALEERKTEIENQEEKIAEQATNLTEKDTKIQEQTLAIYSFLALTILIIIFIIFIIRANRRIKESEHRLSVKNNELVELNESLDSFTYRVSHDLKAPVQNVKNMLSMLNEFSDQSAHPMLPQIHSNLGRSADRLQSTISDMLQLTRIERIDEAKSEVDLKQIINSLVPEYREKLEEANGMVDTSGMKTATVFAAETELTSIFQNLLTNSIKYRSQERNLEVFVSTRMMNGMCELRFSDNGMGIDLKKFEDKLFGMFQRFTSDKAISGTGVGMYIIKKLIEKNNGTLQLESEVGNGLTYIITLPVTATP